MYLYYYFCFIKLLLTKLSTWFSIDQARTVAPRIFSTFSYFFLLHDLIMRLVTKHLVDRHAVDAISSCLDSRQSKNERGSFSTDCISHCLFILDFHILFLALNPWWEEAIVWFGAKFWLVFFPRQRLKV